MFFASVSAVLKTSATALIAAGTSPAFVSETDRNHFFETELVFQIGNHQSRRMTGFFMVYKCRANGTAFNGQETFVMAMRTSRKMRSYRERNRFPSTENRFSRRSSEPFHMVGKTELSSERHVTELRTGCDKRDHQLFSTQSSTAKIWDMPRTSI